MCIVPSMNLLRAYLTENRIRQEDFAVSVGSTQATISKLASGGVRPGLDLAVAIERATGGEVPASSWVPDPSGTPTPEEDAA